MMPIELSLTAEQRVTKILNRYVPEYEVWAFGSRVKGTSRKYSDLDLALITDKPLDLSRLAELREAFSESELPFKVDIVDWATTGEEFRELIRSRYVLIKKKGEE
jgi:predicted nucleotidyltransferase